MINEEVNTNHSGRKHLVIGGIIVVIFLILIIASTVTVPSGHTGVVTVFGRVEQTVLDEGFHVKAPWKRVKKVDNRIVKLSVKTEGSTKDLQTVNTELAVNYRIDSNKSYSIIKNVGTGYEDTLVVPAANEVLKAVMAKYSAEECITKRAGLSKEVVEYINEKLNKQGIFVEDVNIINFNFSKELNAAIEKKQVAEQNKLKAQTDKDKTIIDAEAAAEKKKIAAQADADATLIKAKSQAQANKLLNDSLTDKVTNYKAVEKWDGKLPKVQGSDGTIINFSDITDEKDKDK